MFTMDPQSYKRLKQEIAERMAADHALLEQLRNGIRSLRSEVRPLKERTTTSISLVATDGGNNSLHFDPFLVQIVRIVDSNNNEYCLEVITPTTSITQLSAKQFHPDGSPRTALGEMMNYLGVSKLQELSSMMGENESSLPTNSSWVQVYRELVEWAILFSIIKNKHFGIDVLIVYDGLLRSKVFAADFFKKYIHGVQESIEWQKQKHRRKIYLAGIAKRSKVLTRYRLAMALEGVLTTNYPAYLHIPRAIEEEAYRWYRWAEHTENREDGEITQFVGGKMFFVKFGKGPRDPIWPVDIYLPQLSKAHYILGYMLADAINGFPVPFYPQCLQKAHANAALVDFDFDILQDQIFDGIRQTLAGDTSVLDVFRLQEGKLSQRKHEG